MTFNTKRAINLIFPLIAIAGIAMSLFNFWLIKNTETSIIRKIENIEVDKPNKLNKYTLGTTTPESEEEKREKHKEQNEDFKKRSLEFSPNKIKLAYFQNKLTEDIESLGDSDYVSVIVEQDGKQETVFQEDYHLSYLEWLDDREIVVYRSCGTECLIAYIVDTETKKQQALTLGVGYLWSPNKQYVAALYYSYKYGISIADRGSEHGQTVFQMRRDHPPTGSRLGNKTQVAWSSDSAKLAIVIRKNNEEKLEMVVIDIQKDFETKYQQDLISDDISGIAWEGSSTIILTNAKGHQKISLH